jgi:hypothetical protein
MTVQADLRRVIKRGKKEATAENAVNRWCKENNIPHRKLNGLGFSGWPDKMYPMPRGRMIFIEFKRPGEAPTELQWYVITMLRDRGFPVVICYTKEAAVEFIKQYM